MNSTVAVTTEAEEETKLTTVKRVKMEIGITGSDDDDLLGLKIDDASSDIAVRVRPSLKREAVTETFYPERGDLAVEKIILRRWPAVSVASVTLDDEAVDASEYRLDPETGLLYRLTTSGHPRRWWFTKSLAIEYTAGYLLPGQEGRNLPPSLEAACIELVSSYWASRGRDPTLRSEENVGVARFDYWVGAIGSAGDLPPGVMAKIAPFRAGGFA